MALNQQAQPSHPLSSDAWRECLWRYPGYSRIDPDFLRPRPIGEEVDVQGTVFDIGEQKLIEEKLILRGQGERLPSMPDRPRPELAPMRGTVDVGRLENTYKEMSEEWRLSDSRRYLLEHLDRVGAGRETIVAEAVCMNTGSFFRDYENGEWTNKHLVRLAAFVDAVTHITEQQDLAIKLIFQDRYVTALDCGFLTSLGFEVVHAVPDSEFRGFHGDGVDREEVLDRLTASSFVWDFGLAERKELVMEVLRDRKELVETSLDVRVPFIICSMPNDQEFEQLLMQPSMGVNDYDELHGYLAPYKRSFAWLRLLPYRHDKDCPSYAGFRIPNLELYGAINGANLFVRDMTEKWTATSAEPANLAVERLSAHFEFCRAEWMDSSCRKKLHGMLDTLRPKDGWRINRAVCFGTSSFSSSLSNDHRRFTDLAVFLDVKKKLLSEGPESRIVAQDPVYTHLDRLFLAKLGVETTQGTDADDSEAVELITDSTFVFEAVGNVPIIYVEQLIAAKPRLVSGGHLKKCTYEDEDNEDGLDAGEQQQADFAKCMWQELREAGVQLESIYCRHKFPRLLELEHYSCNLEVCVPKKVAGCATWAVARLFQRVAGAAVGFSRWLMGGKSSESLESKRSAVLCDEE